MGVLIGTLICIAVASALVVLLVWTAPKRRVPAPPASDYEQDERARMPREIADARLVISEMTLYRRGSRPLAAKTDQGFLTRDGLLVMVETKTRRRVSPSDIVQLSCQAVAADSDRRVKWKVANWGYVRLAPAGGKPYYQRVDLVHPTRIDQLWDRWKALKEGLIVPIPRPKPYRCGTCVARTRCRAAVR